MKQKCIIINILIILIIIFSINLIPINVTQAKTTTTTNITNTVQNLEKSNNDLSTLEISGYEITPTFNKNTTTYYVTIPSNVSQLDVNATPEVEKSTVKISGNTKLSKDENTIIISVTSENKSIKTYKIIATKQADNGLKLVSLEIEGCNLNPEFSKDNYYYETNMQKTNDITNLNVIAKANSTTAKVEIIGNNNLSQGENLITILVKDSDKYTTYEIKVNITKGNIIEQQVNSGWASVALSKIKEFFADKTKRISFIIAATFIMLIIIIRLIVKHNKKKRMNKDN